VFVLLSSGTTWLMELRQADGHSARLAARWSQQRGYFSVR